MTPNDDEHRAIRDLRLLMAAPGDAEDKHLGEAEVITIVRKRNLRALFVTDDAGAERHAQDTPQCADTWDILKLAVKKGLLNYSEVMDIRTNLRFYNRVRSDSFVHNPDDFGCWLRK